MAVDYTPSTWLTGIVTTDATYCQIPWSVLGDASQNESDIRNILRGLSESINTHYDTLTSPNIPTKFRPSEAIRYNETTEEFEESYGMKFNLTVVSTALASEPT